MYNIEYLKKLPKIEVSFQDYLSFKDESRFIVLPKKLLLEKEKDGNIQNLVDEDIFLWEIDGDVGDEEYYLCNIGKLAKLDVADIKDSIPKEKLIFFEGNSVFIQVDDNGYFRLPYDTLVLKDKDE